jgi:hypothetical protein
VYKKLATAGKSPAQITGLSSVEEISPWPVMAAGFLVDERVDEIFATGIERRPNSLRDHHRISKLDSTGKSPSYVHRRKNQPAAHKGLAGFFI